MQFLKKVILVLSISTFTVTSFAQVTSANEMATKIFNTLKAKDEKAFVALYPNAQQMSKLMTKMMKGIMSEMKNSPEAMEEMKAEGNMNIDSLVAAELQKKATPEEMAKSHEKYAKEFNQMIEKGEKKGINWNTIELVKFDVDTATVADEAMQKLFGSDQFRSMKGVIHFKADATAYQMSFDKVMFLPEEGGWFGVKLKQLALEGEKLEAETAEDFDESNVVTDEEATVPVKPKTKTKTKTSPSKTKTKTKTKSK